MDCMEAIALKSSLRREINASISISTHQFFYEDLWSGAGINGVSGEDFSVDDLLDFSNGEFHEDVSVEEEEEEKYSLSTSSQEQADDDNNSNTSNFSGSGDSDSLLTDELAVPVDLAELEWVSHFVDDSISELSLLYPAGKLEKPEKNHENCRSESESEPKPVLKKLPSFPLLVPSKARSKRSRTSSSRSWSLGSQLTESPSSSSSSSSGFSSTLCSEFFGEPAHKKQKKKPFSVGGGSTDSFGQFQRRCSHCHVQKTPQWRTGPLGAKTLCNACGVRYKSGRLFPEYRPACSPTFSGDIHSNSHRKVLEMRRTKETDGPEAGLVQMVQSF